LKRKYLIAPLILLAAYIGDQLSKTIAREELFPNRAVIILANHLEFKYAENPGMAFGFFTNLSDGLRLPLFTLITLTAVVIIAHLLRQAPDKAVRLPVALGFILSGAFGNLTDRYRFDGVVVDFIRVWLWRPSRFSWPTFNLADTFITIGILLLVLDMFLMAEEDFTATAPAAQTPPPEDPTSEPEAERPTPAS
jgi:signal peptidase II